ncbi:MAG TPA: deoxyribonuclease IV [Candidatus Acidoferrum sp.]
MPEPKTIPSKPESEVEELRPDPLDDPLGFHDEKFDPEDEYRPEPPAEPLPPVWVDGSLRIGIHASISGSYLNALESARKLGCNALQIFSASPRMWAGGPSRIPENDAVAFRARREELQLGPLVIHANYLINLAGTQPMLRTRSIQAFQDEVVRAVALGADFLVVHPGARGESSVEAAIANIVDSIKQAVRRVQLGSLRILIENTAGMGKAVGSRLEEVAAIVRGLSAIGAGACLDTAHLFAAGYDIATEAGLETTIAQIEKTIGLENVYVWHVNDSKIALGGKVDRHEHIGKGKIKAAAFERILRHPRLGASPATGVPGRAFVLETPIEEPGDDRRNVAKLWELSGEDGPPAEKGYSMLTLALKKKLTAHRKEASRVAKVAARKNLKTKKKG